MDVELSTPRCTPRQVSKRTNDWGSEPDQVGKPTTFSGVLANGSNAKPEDEDEEEGVPQHTSEAAPWKAATTDVIIKEQRAFIGRITPLKWMVTGVSAVLIALQAGAIIT